MAFKTFYAWQSDRPAEFNNRFINECLRESIKRLKKKYNISETEFYLDRDTKDIPGWPNIPETVFDKIEQCDVFLGDLTIIGEIQSEIPKPQMNLNVVSELMFALGKIGEDRIINVMNTAYGNPKEKPIIPFDFAQRRFPILYELSENNIGDRDRIKEVLVTDLYVAIKLIFDTVLERQKLHFAPFYNWRFWGKILKRSIVFEKTEYIKEIFLEIRTSINKPKAILRICGLSGIGKTRLLYECFAHKAEDVPEEITNKLLYVDIKDDLDKKIIRTIKEFIQQEENRILIIDNCPKQLHSELVPLITNEYSKLSLITVSVDPDEKIEDIDSDGLTKLLVLDNQRCKETVTKILANNFSELEKAEQELLVEFSSGISFFATLMATNPNRGRYQPGTLRRQDIIERILGDLFIKEDSKAVIFSCCLFSKIGFFDELSYQADNLSEFPDLCNLNIQADTVEEISELKRRRFRDICRVLNERQLLEKKGRTYAFRPSPLAIRMAEEWWKDCTEPKFKRIIEFLNKNNLIESFCEQFQYLKHIENAKNIVKELCVGVFSLAEVLNSNVGSRLFRSFVYVNPNACNDALIKAFLNLSKSQLEGIIEGRRNLVWALEKLCFRDETFDNATKIMAAFSIGENESYANNATNQFLQLFHIHLPGTSVNLERRWKIIEYCLNKDDDFVFLGIAALNRCLKAESFHRAGGAEEQGDITPLKDYAPTEPEIKDYWGKAIAELEKLGIGRNIYSEKAVNAILNNFYSLVAHFAGDLIIPVLERLFNEKLIDKVEARKHVQFALNSKRVFDESAIKELQRLFDILIPNTFEEKFRAFVQSPSSDEYYTSDREDNHEALLRKIDDLSLEFYLGKTSWNDLPAYLVMGAIAEGFNFGKALSKHIQSDSERVELAKLLIERVKKINKKERNISLLIGLLSEVEEKENQIAIYNAFLSDAEIRDFSFVVARSIELPYEELSKLVLHTKEGALSSVQFSDFNFGWGIKHLKPDEIILFLNSLRSVDNAGKAAAFFIIVQLSHANPELWKSYKEQIKEQLIHDTTDIFKSMHRSMDYFYWSDPVVKLLTDSFDVDFAETILKIIIEECTEFEGFYSKENSFYKILETIQEIDFELLWKYVSVVYSDIEKYGMVAFHFKDLLGSRQDAYANTEGLLFKGDQRKFDIIFEWCRNNRDKKISWISELLPIYQKESNDNIAWHPYAKNFIDEFGQIDEVLSHISAKMGTYSWVGTVVPRLKGDRKLFELLLDHPIENVRTWAIAHMEDLDKRIRWEENRDEDEVWI